MALTAAAAAAWWQRWRWYVIVSVLVAVAVTVTTVLLLRKSGSSASGGGSSSGGGGSQDCVPASTWSEWSDCSVECGDEGGWQFATRAIDVLPSGGGAPCTVDMLVSSQSCNVGVPCGLPCIPNPDPDAFAWSGCANCIPPNVTTVTEWRIVPPLQEATDGGTPCSTSDVFQVRACPQASQSCVINQDCVISTTSTATVLECNVPCGVGVAYVMHSVSVPQSGRGTGCDWNLLVEQVPCTASINPCPTTQSCNDVVWPSSELSWTPCDVMCGVGTQWQTRAAEGPLDTCPLVRTRTCTAMPVCTGSGDPPYCCPTVAPDGSNAPCDLPSAEILETLCYMQCAGMPLPSSLPTSDGTFCSISSAQLTYACSATLGFVDGCVEPTPCSLTAFSTWSGCSVPQCDSAQPQGGLATANRSIVSYEMGGGAPCSDFPLNISMPCNNMGTVSYSSLSSDGQTWVGALAPPQCVPVNCVQSEWTLEEPCNVQCGNGTETYIKTLISSASGGGDCPTDPSAWYSVSTCTQPSCQNCVFMSQADWLQYCTSHNEPCWSPCSSPCGGTMSVQAPMTISASPGGTCDMSWGYYTADCCTDCICQASCPVDDSGVVCGDNGTCVSVTDTTMTGGWSFSCDCNSGFSGYACDVKCPINPLGTSCGVDNWLGQCTADGDCDCVYGVTGQACEQGGWCVITGSDPTSCNQLCPTWQWWLPLPSPSVDGQVNQALCGGLLAFAASQVTLDISTVQAVASVLGHAPAPPASCCNSTWQTGTPPSIADLNTALAALAPLQTTPFTVNTASPGVFYTSL